MPDGTYHTIKAAWEVIKYPMVMLVGLFGWSLKRQISRVDKLEASYIDKDAFNDTLSSLRTDIKDGFKEIRADVRDIHQRIDNQKDES
jgi:hypothetical protein